MSDSWIHFGCEAQGRPVQILINIGLTTEVPQPKRTVLSWIGVYCLQPPEGAFWNPSETEMLDMIEDLLRKCANDSDSTYALRIASAGLREYFVYAVDTTFQPATLETLRQQFPAYRIEGDTTNDPDWTHYRGFSGFVQQAK